MSVSVAAGQQRWVDVAVFEDVNDAKTIESFLMKKRLEARTYDDKVFRFLLFLRPPRVTHRVQVRHNSLKCAGDFLNAGAPAALQRAIHCPACDSLRVFYPELARKSILPMLRSYLRLVFRRSEHECYCERCHLLWNLPGENVNPAPQPAGHSSS